MATKSKDVIKLTKDDFEGFKAAPSGKYTFLITKKSSIKKGASGNVLNVAATISSGPHKGTTVFDNIAPHVGWKIAQLLSALGIKKMQLTLQELLKLITGKSLRAVVRTKTFEGKKRNEIVQWLPLAAAEGEEDIADDDELEDEEALEEEVDELEEEDEADADDADEDEEEEEEDADADDDDDEEDEEDEEEDGADDDDDDEDDDEEEIDDDFDDVEEDEDEAPAPKRSKRTAAKKAPAKKAKPAAKKSATKKRRR